MKKLFRNINNGFKCLVCGFEVTPLSSGGRNRNHCPSCLCSLHVDENIPGDRQSSCLGIMRPTGLETRRTGEYVLIHKCEKCGKISKNRIAGDDDWDKIIHLTS